jgi:uncharacterized heparinase superfamily protein
MQWVYGPWQISMSDGIPSSFPARALGHRLTWPASALSARISGLAVPIKPLLKGCAEIGKQIYHGKFRFHGKEVNCRGAMIFDAAVPDLSWLEELHGFTWLIHMEATALELGRVHARALIWDWLERNRHRQRSASALPVVCRRLMSWIIAAAFLFDRADENFVTEFTSSLARHVRDLQLRSALSRSSALRLDCAVALAFAAVGLKGLEPSIPAALALLAERLDTQILPDGGHISRNPAELVRLLLNLVPLRLACEEARIEIPARFHAALERMLPMLRFFVHGDNGLAIFQGACDPLINECSAILEADDTRGRPLSNALYSGYARLSHGSATVICDTGLPAGDSLNPRCASSPLALEFSDSTCRMVVNCGSPLSQTRLMAVARLPQAHSTATLSSEFSKQRNPLPICTQLGLVRKLPLKVETRLDSPAVGSLLEASHNAYESQLGCLHQRRLFLSATGDDFRGEDRFIPVSLAMYPNARFIIRFHLHPAVKATLSMGGANVMLLMPNKAGWKFSARGADIRLEESICLWGKPGPRKTMQIVLNGCATDEPINWAFKRCRSRSKPADELASSAVLPL